MSNSIIHRLALVAFCLGFLGCAGQLKGAMADHAQSTRTVAETISKATSQIQCDDIKAESAPACKAAVATLNDQAKALSESSDKLTNAAK